MASVWLAWEDSYDPDLIGVYPDKETAEKAAHHTGGTVEERVIGIPRPEDYGPIYLVQIAYETGEVLVTYEGANFRHPTEVIITTLHRSEFRFPYIRFESPVSFDDARRVGGEHRAEWLASPTTPLNQRPSIAIP